MQKSFTDELGADLHSDPPIVIATMPASARQRKIAFGAFIILVAVIAVTLPFANVQLARIDGFVPAVQTVMCAADLFTAVFLFAQYSIFPQRALLVLATGYVFSGLFVFLQTLAFTGAYAPNNLTHNGDELTSSGWLFVCGHTLFSLSVIVYTLSKNGNAADDRPRPSSGTTIGLSIACVLTATAGLTWIATAGAGYLPSLYESATRQTRFAHYLSLFLSLLSATALVLLFVRRRTILDQWLIVVLFAWLPNFVVSAVFAVVRFTVGWYVARIFALFAGSALLFVLLAETMALYARLADAILLLRRERAHRLTSLDAATSAMAHEIRQPLAGLAARGAAGLSWLSQSPPNLEKVRDCLTGMVESSHRAEEIISSIRGLFKKTSSSRAAVQINDVTREALALAQHDLDINNVTVTTEYQENIPTIDADRTQLQQVILNMVNNAIEAMHGVSPGKRHLRILTGFDEKSLVSIYVQDTGSGIAVEDQGRIFEPFFTTKPSGTGLGLSICQTIVESHGGNLRLVKTDSYGSSFEISFPLSSSSDGCT
jgi:signal transduction histidine kinase